MQPLVTLQHQHCNFSEIKKKIIEKYHASVSSGSSFIGLKSSNEHRYPFHRILALYLIYRIIYASLESLIRSSGIWIFSFLSLGCSRLKTLLLRSERRAEKSTMFVLQLCVCLISKYSSIFPLSRTCKISKLSEILELCLIYSDVYAIVFLVFMFFI